MPLQITKGLNYPVEKLTDEDLVKGLLDAIKNSNKGRTRDNEKQNLIDAVTGFRDRMIEQREKYLTLYDLNIKLTHVHLTAVGDLFNKRDFPKFAALFPKITDYLQKTFAKVNVRGQLIQYIRKYL